MINWVMTVIEQGGHQHPAVVIEPDDGGQHDAIAHRLRRSGLRYLTVDEFTSVRWPLTQCTATLVYTAAGRALTEIHTGRSRFTATELVEAGALFVEHLRTRILLCLVPPATLPATIDVSLRPEQQREQLGMTLEKAAAGRVLLAGMALVRDQPAPAPR